MTNNQSGEKIHNIRQKKDVCVYVYMYMYTHTHTVMVLMLFLEAPLIKKGSEEHPCESVFLVIFLREND